MVGSGAYFPFSGWSWVRSSGKNREAGSCQPGPGCSGRTAAEGLPNWMLRRSWDRVLLLCKGWPWSFVMFHLSAVKQNLDSVAADYH